MLDIENNILPTDDIARPSFVVQPRHRVILQALKEGVSMRQAMASVGYTGRSLESPTQTLTKTKSWKALMNEYLSEEVLAARHNELINLRTQRALKDNKGNIVSMETVIDSKAVTPALDMAYKLRGSYKEAAAPAKSQTVYNLFYKPEVRAQVKAFEEGLKQQMINEANRTRNQREDSDDPEGYGGGTVIDV